VRGAAGNCRPYRDRKIYSTRQDARADVFDYIEMFYNPKRRHGFNKQLSPIEFEKRYSQSLESV
jgi:putative transposase